MEKYYDEVRNTLIIVLLLNLIIAGAKIAYGYYTGILSISSDGYDSFLDAIANIVGILAVIVAKKPQDKEHPYGHAKLESFASILIGLSLIIVSYEILISAYEKFINPANIEISLISFAVMISTLIINILLSQYEKRKARYLNSDLLLADSKHTQSDIYATSIVIIGLVLMNLGISVIDPIISILIALLIIKTGLSILQENLNVLVDANIIPTASIHDMICDIDGVENVHNIRTRGTSSSVFVDMHIVVDSNISMKKAHDISHKVEKKLKNEFTQIIDVLIHLESEDGMDDLKELD